MKTIAFAGSNSSKSINHQLVSYAASLLDNSELIKLNDFEIPMYNIDIEEEKGIPYNVKALHAILSKATFLVISVAEHNGNITAFFKNILDWLSRYDRNFLENKKIVLLSTSPGKGGANNALQITKKTLPYFKGEVIETLSIGDFYSIFNKGIITNKQIDNQLKSKLLTINI